MEGKEEEIPEIQAKQINGVEITNLEIAKISMIFDYLVLDRFQDFCSFLRLEKCFGPFFPKESHDFFIEVFREICGPKHKYISYGRLIFAYTKWKSKEIQNENFNKFMNELFNKIIETKEKNIGKIIEGGRIFSTRNTNFRKIISKFSVITDPTKNKINGFHIQYDDVFDTILSPDKTKDNITLEMNFIPNGRNIRDRDGISHIGGKYSVDKGIIKFLIFKCRSGKTFYIGDEKEEAGENIKNFLFGTSSCQLKSVRVEIVEGNLIYLETRFQPSLRVNQKILDFDSIDENYIKNNIINSPLIFEENEIQNMPEEEFKKFEQSNGLIIPCINDDAFIDKKELEEPLSGKDFNEIYKSFIADKKENEEKEIEDLKKTVYEKTIARKHLLRVYLRKFKVKENISVLRSNRQPKNKISQDKFLAKIKAYRKKMDKNIKEKKEELKKEESDNDSYWNDEEEKDWPKDDGIEIKEKKEEKEEGIQKIKLEENKEEKDEKNNQIVEDKKEEKIEEKKEENKEEIVEEIVQVKKEEKKEEKNETKVEVPNIEPENKIKENKEDIIEIGKKEEPVEEPIIQEKIILRGRPKKLLQKKINNTNEEKEKNKVEENKEEDKKDEIIIKEEQIIEEPKKEEAKLKEIKIEEPKINEIKNEKKIIKESNEIELKDQIIVEEDNGMKENLITDKKNAIDKGKNKNDDGEAKPKINKCFCNVF